MKYIKKFEAITNYEVSDYILLDIDKIKDNNKNASSYYEPIDNMAIITAVHNYQDAPLWYVYDIEFYNGKDLDFNSITDEEIKRKLTTEEIEKFNLKVKTNKYNL